jgi:hypothetical protein
LISRVDLPAVLEFSYQRYTPETGFSAILQTGIGGQIENRNADRDKAGNHC